eukprot:GHVQ01033159.1.p1 GENE.GHVQ01033159.1~~GHVQ01033159.1.p1  ORF type:complete len:236 (+),score=24.79 GHVQ01033159.1:54-710(+)
MIPVIIYNNIFMHTVFCLFCFSGVVPKHILLRCCGNCVFNTRSSTMIIIHYVLVLLSSTALLLLLQSTLNSVAVKLPSHIYPDTTTSFMPISQNYPSSYRSAPAFLFLSPPNGSSHMLPADARYALSPTSRLHSFCTASPLRRVVNGASDGAGRSSTSISGNVPFITSCYRVLSNGAHLFAEPSQAYYSSFGTSTVAGSGSDSSTVVESQVREDHGFL